MGRYFTIGELCESETAARNGIKNQPNPEQKLNMNKLIDNVLDPLRAAYGKPIHVNSGFRCEALNRILPNASKTSQHMRGMAADITVFNKKENKKLFDLVQKLGLEYDQLINESDYIWVHISYNEDNNRNQILHL